MNVRAALPFLMAGVGALGLGAIPVVFALNRANELAALEAEIADCNQAVSCMTPELVKALDTSTAAMSTTLPGEMDTVGVLHAISADLAELHVTDRSLSTGVLFQQDQIQCMPVSVSFIGPLAQAHQLVTRVESHDRLLRVDKLEIASRGDGSLEVTVQLTAFAEAAAGGEG